MPFVHIRVVGAQLASAEVATLQKETTRLMADVMHKKAELTAVLVEEQADGCWSIGGMPASIAAHLDVKVTAGTNNADEKASFIRQAHALLTSVIGEELPLATYVIVDEVAADAWGYGGRTQEARRSGLA